MAEKELGIKPKYDSGGRKPAVLNQKLYQQQVKRVFPILNQLDARVDKIDKVIKDLLVSEEPLTKQLSKVIVDKTGISQANFINLRNRVPSYTCDKVRSRETAFVFKQILNNQLFIGITFS